jgi:hypothetical protein
MKLSQNNLARLAAVAALVVFLYFLMNSYSATKFLGEGLEIGGLEPQGPLSNDSSYAAAVNPHSEGGDMAPSMSQEGQHPPTAPQTYNETVLSSDDLLPKGGVGASWAATNPLSKGDLQGQNFLSSSYHNGINTVGTTLRNANLSLRSDPPNPRAPVSPFLNSTIETNKFQRPLEIGEAGGSTQ